MMSVMSEKEKVVQNEENKYAIENFNTEMFGENTEFHEKADVTNLRERLAAIPIATPDMTPDQLRQICVSYIKLSVSFQWIADRYMSFVDKHEKTFYKGKLNGGIPYINTASGNLYRILEYYNDETGELDCSFFSENPSLFGTACSGTASTAWQRVINSVESSWTHSMNMAHGFIPVGPYVYDYSQKQIWEKRPNEKKRFYFYNAKNVCKANGEQVMYESYALTKPADCYSSNGHVRLSIEVPSVFRKEDGTIDGEKSFVLLAEQGLYTKGDYHRRKTKDGTDYLIRGNDGYPYTFKELFDAGYLVHTFKEFLGLKKFEKSEIRLTPREGSEDNTVLSDLVTCNYPISDLFMKVKNEKGEVVHESIYRVHPHYVRTVSLAKALPTDEIRALEEQSPLTLEIEAQISTGEKKAVYCGPVKKEKEPESAEATV